MKRIYLLIVMSLLSLTIIACEDIDTRPVVTYAGWNLGTEEQNNIERQMLSAFQELHPEIKLEIIPRPIRVDDSGNEVETDWFDFFSTRAATGNLPDVYQVADITTWIIQGWLDDVSDLVQNDADFALIPDDVAYNAKYDEFLFALPQALYYYGFFIDKTVINSITNHVDIEYGITLDDLMAAAKTNSVYDWAGEGSGIAGIDGMGAFIEWVPAQYDNTLDWFTFNSQTGYHLNSTAFETALNLQKNYLTPSTNTSFVLENMDENERSAQYGTQSPWEVGKQSIKWSQSYNMRDWIANTQNQDHPMYGHELDFIGTPSVNGTQKIPVILDHLGIANGSRNREIAYELAKWMSFGVDGYKKRIEIATENPTSGAINFAPITQNQEIIDMYFELYPTMIEFKKIVQSHDTFIQESLWKTTPGYWDSRANGAFNESDTMATMINKVINSEVQYADVKDQLNTRANALWQTAQDNFNQAIEKYRNDRQ